MLLKSRYVVICIDPVEYIIVVEVNASETVAVSKIRSSVNSVILPFQVDNGVEITAFNISTGEPVKMT